MLDQPHARRPRPGGLPPAALAIAARPSTSWPRVDTGPSQALVAPLASKHDEFVAQLDDARLRLTKAAGVSAAVATILQGPQTYVVLASNNAEMRSGSGAFLDVGVATTSDGSVQLGDLSPSGRPDPPGRCGPGDRRLRAELGLAQPEPGHAQPRSGRPSSTSPRRWPPPCGPR